MTPPADTARYKNHRFPGEIISHGVWLYYRFTLSYRDVEELLFERGITVSHEAIRYCWRIYFKVLEALSLASVSQAFLPSKKACGIHKFRHFWVRQQYPIC